LCDAWMKRQAEFEWCLLLEPITASQGDERYL